MIIKRYMGTREISKGRPQWIHSRVKEKRIMAYQIYYELYWEWEHMEDETRPTNDKEWIEYFETTGCANHRDLVESIHIMLSDRKQGVDFRYGVTLSNTKTI